MKKVQRYCWMEWPFKRTTRKKTKVRRSGVFVSEMITDQQKYAANEALKSKLYSFFSSSTVNVSSQSVPCYNLFLILDADFSSPKQILLFPFQLLS
ncbi:hypothetical protein HRI_004633300 [Hibiscus trionum]|uniref:Uncharacterized protein n=1 Tax=Hibiscus trionum TaxID=183268 RepID=A0A9W7MUD2_HIBTR|nr:hypothetical protein HRI_004633300 [Hibiscus trionum]